MRKTKKAVKTAPKKVQRGGRKSKAVVEQVLADYDTNMSPEKICKKYNISARTLFRYQLRRKVDNTTAKQTVPVLESSLPKKRSWMKEQLDYAHDKMNKDLEKQFERNASYQKQKVSVVKCLTCNNLVKTATNVDGTNFYMPTAENVLSLADSPHNCPTCGSKMAGSLADAYKGNYPPRKLDDVKNLYTTESSQRQGFDPVNKPAHYADSKIEVIDFIEDKGFGYHLGNAVRLICKGQYESNDTISNRLQTLKKAAWFLQREIKNIENSNQKTI